MNYTPRPWNVQRSLEDDTMTKIVDENNTLIADTYAYSASGEGLPNQDEAEANAVLMAAAPEMLEELMFLESKASSGIMMNPNWYRWNRIRQLIRKAGVKVSDK